MDFQAHIFQIANLNPGFGMTNVYISIFVFQLELVIGSETIGSLRFEQPLVHFLRSTTLPCLKQLLNLPRLVERSILVCKLQMQASS